LPKIGKLAFASISIYYKNPMPALKTVIELPGITFQKKRSFNCIDPGIAYKK
jgi:hypothetical protein